MKISFIIALFIVIFFGIITYYIISLLFIITDKAQKFKLKDRASISSLNKYQQVFLLLVVLVIFAFLFSRLLGFEYEKNSIEDIFVEFHGLVFDTIFILLIFEFFRDKAMKKEKIESIEKEIKNLRGWHSEHSVALITSKIIQLLELKKENLDLRWCYLNNAKLDNENFIGVDLRYSVIFWANFQGSKIIKSKFHDLDGRRAIFKDAKIRSCNFSFSNFEIADFSKAEIIDVSFMGSKIRHGIFVDSLIIGVDFSKEVDLSESKFISSEIKSSKLKIPKNQPIKIMNTNIISSDISKSDFTSSDISGLVISDSKIDGAIFKESQCNSIRFIRCKGKPKVILQK